MAETRSQYLIVTHGNTGADDSCGISPEDALNGHEQSLGMCMAQIEEDAEIEKSHHAVYKLPEEIVDEIIDELENADSDGRLEILKDIIKKHPIEPIFLISEYRVDGELHVERTDRRFEVKL